MILSGLGYTKEQVDWFLALDAETQAQVMRDNNATAADVAAIIASVKAEGNTMATQRQQDIVTYIDANAGNAAAIAKASYDAGVTVSEIVAAYQAVRPDMGATESMARQFLDEHDIPVVGDIIFPIGTTPVSHETNGVVLPGTQTQREIVAFFDAHDGDAVAIKQYALTQDLSIQDIDAAYSAVKPEAGITSGKVYDYFDALNIPLANGKVRRPLSDSTQVLTSMPLLVTPGEAAKIATLPRDVVFDDFGRSFKETASEIAALPTWAKIAAVVVTLKILF